MNYCGAIFFDYDGTLSDEREGIFYPTEKTKKAVACLKENGWFICLSTGRAKCYAPISCGIEFDGLIASNGAYAELLGKPIYKAPFSRELTEEITKYFNDSGMFYSAESQTECYARDVNEKSFRNLIDNFNINAEIFHPFSEAKDTELYKMLVTFENEAQFDRLKAVFSGKLVFDKHRLMNSCDVSAYGVTKACGVRAILDKLSVPHEKTYAFGDGTNDIDMFYEVKHSAAMGIAAESTKKAAEYVTDIVKEEGVSKALLHFGLIKESDIISS